MAAIQGLSEKLDEAGDVIDERDERIEDLEGEVSARDDRIETLEAEHERLRETGGDRGTARRKPERFVGFGGAWSHPTSNGYSVLYRHCTETSRGLRDRPGCIALKSEVS